MPTLSRSILLALAALLALGGCKKQEETVVEPVEEDVELVEEEEEAVVVEDKAPEAADEPMMARAELTSAPGKNVKGMVMFTEKGGEVVIEASIEGLSPGMHGFHIHENGACDAPDFKSAGGHFNPTNEDHGGPDDAKHHAGDFGNIEAKKGEPAMMKITDAGITLGDGDNSVIGKALIIHAKADDLKSQPSGEAGPRVACGIIQAAEGGAMQDDHAGHDHGDHAGHDH